MMREYVAYGMRQSMYTSAVLVLLAAALMGACSDRKQDDAVPARFTFTAPRNAPTIDGAAAFALIERQVAFGPRVPGTPAHTACRDFLIDALRGMGWTCELQSFTMPGYDGETLQLHNIVARLHPERTTRVLLTAHWDTRPMADMESDESSKRLPIAGANDGASGVAVLLEVARSLAARPAGIGVDIVLFDGEDYGRSGDESMFCLGSKYYAASLSTDDVMPVFGVLLDLVGDRDAVFPREGHSDAYARDIVDLFWGRAAALGLRQFSSSRHDPIIDDHVPLNQVAGIKTINIIDAELVGHATSDERRKYWHTLQDTPAQCAPETLAAVGNLLLHVLHGMEAAGK